MKSYDLLDEANSCILDWVFDCLKDGNNAFLVNLVLVCEVDLGCFIAT